MEQADREEILSQGDGCTVRHSASQMKIVWKGEQETDSSEEYGSNSFCALQMEQVLEGSLWDSLWL